MYYRRACFSVEDVLLGYMFYRWAYLTGWFVMFDWSTCFKGVCIFHRMIYLTGGYLLDEDRFYWRVCVFGSHV